MRLSDFYEQVTSNNIIPMETIVYVQIFENWPKKNDFTTFIKPCKLRFAKANVRFGDLQIKKICPDDNKFLFCLAD